MPTFNAVPLRSATIIVPRVGPWTAIAKPAGALTLAPGAPVALVVGDTSFFGSVLTGGTFVSDAGYAIVAGSFGWSKTIPPKGHAIAPGQAGDVHAADVATAIAYAAGERDPGPPYGVEAGKMRLDLAGYDRILGDHWTRRGGVPASVAMNDLLPLPPAGPGWRVDPDGYLRPGMRPPVPVAGSVQLAVELYEPLKRWARITSPTDSISALLPGSVIGPAAAPTLTAPLVVGTSTIYVDRDAVAVEVLGEAGLVELWAALVVAFTPPPTFGGLWAYVVQDAGPSGGAAPSLKATSSAPGLPDTVPCALLFGVPGVTATLVPGARVWVEFLGGNPALPRVVQYDGTLPSVVNIGGSDALARAAQLVTWAGGVNDALVAAGHPAAALSSNVATAILRGG